MYVEDGWLLTEIELARLAPVLSALISIRQHSDTDDTHTFNRLIIGEKFKFREPNILYDQ